MENLIAASHAAGSWVCQKLLVAQGTSLARLLGHQPFGDTALVKAVAAGKPHRLAGLHVFEANGAMIICTLSAGLAGELATEWPFRTPRRANTLQTVCTCTDNVHQGANTGANMRQTSAARFNIFNCNTRKAQTGGYHSYAFIESFLSAERPRLVTHVVLHFSRAV